MQIILMLPMLEAMAGHYGAIRAAMEKHGTPIGDNDRWIAAHAGVTSLTLVTNNER